MEFSLSTTPLESLQSDCVITGIYENKELSASSAILDKITNGLISQLLDRGDFDGKMAEVLMINVIPNSTIQRILLIGLGSNATLSTKQYRKILSNAAKSVKTSKTTNVANTLTEIDVDGFDAQWKTRQIVEIFNNTYYQFTELKSKKPPALKLHELQIMASTDTLQQAESGLQQGLAIARGMDVSKRLADLPGNICTPSYLAEQSIEIANQHDTISINILEEADMEKLGMGSLLSVSRGSREPAKLICMEYHGDSNDTKPYVLVGKGLTFDAGGISLKPGAGMDEMKYDMCGGACVIGTLQAVAELNLPINVVGLIPTSENLPDGDANKPGDIVTSMAGLTIEILNTDAEGRLILCDTLTYAKKYDPEVVIDLATLTGACLVALGRVPSGLLSDDDGLCTDLLNASETACDSIWRLPLWEEYQDQLKSNFADIANIGGRDAGTITAACFLSRFTEDFRWAHLDIAGTAWRTGAQKGATGRPVPLLTQYLIDCADAKH